MDKHTAQDRVRFRSSLQPLKQPTFAIVNALQHETPDIQVEAVSLALVVMAQSLGLDPHELVSRSKRQIADADAIRNPHIEAVRDYAAGELR